ncbi:MAG: hypothetical protein SOT28_07335 [Fusicatenibacter sp.]|nr:hypothetical protein [Lachnospiraceae bacterium]MDY2938102.1 hypothetical protein [Fusicatenibacter sp.]
MNFLDKMERKYGRYAIHHLTAYIIVTYIAGYLIELTGTGLSSYLTLEPYYILHGQIWRLVSWILIPPGSLDIFTIIMLMFYYSIGTSLERAWGEFRYNVYIFSGIFMTIIGSFLLYGIMYLIYGAPYSMGYQFSTYYISLSIFLGFAISFPDMKVLLYFIIPIKIKWLAFVDVAYLAIEVVGNLYSGNWPQCVAILCSLANVLVFFCISRKGKRVSFQQQKRKKEFQKAVSRGQAEHYRGNGVTKHKCAICGRTELDDPNLEFRFCSKCNGNYEYCQDHLFTHEHVK